MAWELELAYPTFQVRSESSREMVLVKWGHLSLGLKCYLGWWKLEVC